MQILPIEDISKSTLTTTLSTPATSSKRKATQEITSTKKVHLEDTDSEGIEVYDLL
jgi:hypothetical protein